MSKVLNREQQLDELKRQRVEARWQQSTQPPEAGSSAPPVQLPLEKRVEPLFSGNVPIGVHRKVVLRIAFLLALPTVAFMALSARDPAVPPSVPQPKAESHFHRLNQLSDIPVKKVSPIVLSVRTAIPMLGLLADMDAIPESISPPNWSRPFENAVALDPVQVKAVKNVAVPKLKAQNVEREDVARVLSLMDTALAGAAKVTSRPIKFR